MHPLTYLFLFSFICATINATNIKCSKYKLNNGRVRMKQNSKLARFLCNKGYMLIGTKYSGCINGYFDMYPPICVNNKPNCKKITGLKNGLIIPEANNIVVHFFCKPEFKLIGSNVTICDGDNWIFQLPFCKSNNSLKPETSCDFERDDICDWNHDLNHDFDWKRTNLQTPTPETGPKFDHTKGFGKNGHFMYVESTSRLVNDSSRLISAIFDKMAAICVRFYYHMYGRDMGTLNVYIKQENEDFQKLRPLFSVSGNQGDIWNLGQISLENGVARPFQVIFEGIRGKSYFSDIAIDDVSINNEACPEEALETTETLFSSDATSEMPNFDSCLNRCGENGTNFENLATCSCDENCFELNLCCADFIQYCFLGLETSNYYEDVIETSTSDTTFELSTNPTDFSSLPPKRTTDVTPTLAPKTTDIITNTTLKITDVITTLAPKITDLISNFPPEITTILAPKKPTVAPKKPPIVVTIIPKIRKTTTTTTTTTTTPAPTTITTIPAVLTEQPAKISNLPPKIETDFLAATLQPNVEYLQKNAKNDAKTSNNLFIYVSVVASIVFVTFSVVFLAILVKRNVLNCKKFNNSRDNDSMSDVRFLTTDEVLDFTWKRAESL